MVNGIGSNVIQNQQTLPNAAVNHAAYYTTNTLKPVLEADTFTSQLKGQLPWLGIFQGIPFARYLMKNHTLGGQMTQHMVTVSEGTKAAFRNIFKGSGKLTERIAQYFDVINKSKTAYGQIKGAAKAGVKVVKLQKATEKALGKLAENSSKRVTEKAAKTVTKLANAKVKAAQALKAAETAAAVTAEKGVAQAAVKAGKFSKLGKAMKSVGAGFMLVMSGIFEAITEVIPTFNELGAKKGVKQLCKSTVKVVADTAGFIAGEQLGMAIGGAIGSFILPGIGTAIGSAVGFMGGFIGSHFAGKLTKAVVGKSEREIAQEQQQNILSDNTYLNNNPFSQAA